MNWITVDSGVSVRLGAHDFEYLNKRTNEDSLYGYSVLEGIAHPIGTRKNGVTETQILDAISQWLPFKYTEDKLRKDYDLSVQELQKAWDNDAKFLIQMAKSIVVPHNLKGVKEIALYFEAKSKSVWGDYCNQWRHSKYQSQKSDYLTSFLDAQTKILQSLMWMQKNRQLIESVIDYEKNTSSIYYEIILALPVKIITSVVHAQIKVKRQKLASNV